MYLALKTVSVLAMVCLLVSVHTSVTSCRGYCSQFPW